METKGIFELKVNAHIDEEPLYKELSKLNKVRGIQVAALGSNRKLVVNTYQREYQATKKTLDNLTGKSGFLFKSEFTKEDLQNVVTAEGRRITVSHVDI